MTTFIWTVVAIFVIEAIGKAEMLRKNEMVRNPAFMVLDIAIAMVLVGWGLWVLARA